MPHAPDLSGCALDDRYELHAVIGEGAFGRVYEGRDRRLDRPVAVKVIKPWWTEDPQWVATFERETQLLARVSDPGIVQIFDVGHAPEGLYYVSELVDGENLAGRLRRGPLPAWEACGVAAQLCRALARAHAERIVHRDVKPANILLSTEGRVKVGDFGVARLAEGSTDGAAATIVGTPRYMAPEQGRGLATSPATDVYSVGVVLYEMLSGAPPFTGDTVVELALRHLQETPAPLSVRLPPSLIEITSRALAKDPADRFADGAEMAEALLQARRGSASGRRARLAPARSRSPLHRSPPVPVGAGVQAPVAAAPGGDGGPPASRRDPDPITGPDRLTSGSSSAPSSREPDATRRAPVLSPRRNVNPSARRRAAAALGSVVVLLVAMVVAAIALSGPARTRVPRLTDLSLASARAVARRAQLAPDVSHRYEAKLPAGTVAAQRPAARARVVVGARIQIVVSLGPAPVTVPPVTRGTRADAVRSLTSLRFRPTVHLVPAPGTPPGTVVGQSPAGGLAAPVGSRVGLTVAETPTWRSLTTFRGASSGAFHITGERWRIVYDMGFRGTCTWIFWCSGPTARVTNAATGQTVARFGLGDGSGRTRTLATGPGRYEIAVTPGGDQSAWSIRIADDY